MKKICLVSILAVGALFAASGDETALAKSFSEKAFELDLKAAKLEKEARDLKMEFYKQIDEKLAGLTDEQKRNFMIEFNKNLDEKIGKLSVNEARELGIRGHRGHGYDNHERGMHRGFGNHMRGMHRGGDFRGQCPQNGAMMGGCAGNPENMPCFGLMNAQTNDNSTTK